ncbi:MAG: trigger factor [Bacillota bacterium]|nr:trigger factor [Bacillota bacterium]
MKVDLSYPEKHVALLSIDVETDRIAEVRERVYRRLVRKYSIPGFRKGKAPQAILERYVGPEAFDQEVLDELLPAAYQEALGQASVQPVTPPQVEVTQWQRGEPLLFKATVTTKPEVALGQYTGLEVRRDAADVTDEAVQADLSIIQRRLAELVDAPAGAPLAHGSVAVVDFAATVDGSPLEGGSAQDYPLEIGSGQFVPGFEEQLAGAKVGDERELAITFPADYEASLAGKEALFKVTVKGHRVRNLPELDDEFARKAAPLLGLEVDEEGFGLERLRAEIRRRLEAGAENRVRADYERRVVDAVMGNSQLEVPEVMIANRAAALRRGFVETLERRKLTLQEYMTAGGQTEVDLESGFRLRAEGELRRELVMEAIARKEGISAGEQEVDERITTMARLYGQDPARLRAALEQGDRRSDIAAEIVARKTIDYLVGAQVPVGTRDEPGNVTSEEGQVQPADSKEEKQ